MDKIYDSLYLSLAAEEARKFEGATAPNPPVGALVVRNSKVLAVGAHQRAGTEHAEIHAIKKVLETHGKETLKDATLYVTLEPCNHQGKTPPCTNAILESGIGRVVIGTRDANPTVKGHGAEYLLAQGLEVRTLDHPECKLLTAPFHKWAATQAPWLVHKIAVRRCTDGSLTMTPERGKKTFTRTESLLLAHEERKRSDGILTTMKTVLADFPLFTVRECQDHPGKTRVLAVFTRTPRATLPDDVEQKLNDWIMNEEKLGLEVLFFSEIDLALAELGKRGAHRVLLEAGPSFSEQVLEKKLADETLWIYHDPEAMTDKVMRAYKKGSF